MAIEPNRLPMMAIRRAKHFPNRQNLPKRDGEIADAQFTLK